MNYGEKKLRIFFLEDNLDDIELELYQLNKAGIDFEYEVARDREEFLKKIPDYGADIILADYSLPDITGIEAIEICKELGLDVPVIFITGEGNELIAVDSLRLGATDYIIKRNIAGLPARIKRALNIWSDHKARERAEAEERRLQVLLYETQKMEAIGRLAGGIAHDFNNILTGILGFSEICLSDIPEDSNIRTKINSISSLSRRGADLVKQLLIFSRKMPLEFNIVNFNSFIKETLHFLNRIVEETIEVKLDIEKDVFNIKCDTGQFTQVVMNLILNARDAMDGKGVITIKTEKCVLTDDLLQLKPEGYCNEYICFSVSDTGTGIDLDDIQKIFDPFFTTKELDKGTGLGLSIVHSVVNSHGGFIKVFSKKDVGTAFKIYLPICELSKLEQKPLYYKKFDRGDIEKISGNETVLFAEDEDVIRDLFSFGLSNLGYNVVVAKNGDEAFEIYRSGHQKIDIVVSDMLMPIKGGVELFKELESINPDIKFILLTGYSLAGQDENALKKMKAIQTKPCTPRKIASLMREILGGEPR